MNYMQIEITDVGPDTGERHIVVESPNDVEFGVFDGYKTGEDGIARPATAPWMDGEMIQAVLIATVDVSISPSGRDGPEIKPNEENSTEYHNHTFVGSITSVHESGTELLCDTSLYDGLDQTDSGIGVVDSPEPVAVLSTGEGDILLNISDMDTDPADLDLSVIYDVCAGRTDVLGYVQDAEFN